MTGIITAPTWKKETYRRFRKIVNDESLTALEIKRFVKGYKRNEFRDLVSLVDRYGQKIENNAERYGRKIGANVAIIIPAILETRSGRYIRLEGIVEYYLL